MTGYGSVCQQVQDSSVEVIVQSVNGKILDICIQMPNFYSDLEKSVRILLKKYFVRGTVHISVCKTPLDSAKIPSIQWNRNQALQWKILYKKIAQELKVQNDLSVTHLIKQPGVLLSNSSSQKYHKEKSALLKLIHKAIIFCNQERIREGYFLKKEFLTSFKKLSIYLKSLKVMSAHQKNQAQKSFKQKIKKLDSSIDSINKDKILQEVADWLSKIDVQEELVRIKEHLAKCKSLLSSKQPIGKKINFYLQEMVREINTVGSKSHSAIFSQKIISAKSLIESLREQIHNVE